LAGSRAAGMFKEYQLLIPGMCQQDQNNHSLKIRAILSIMFQIDDVGIVMKTMSARDAKNGFGLLLDTARAEPVTIEKHSRPVVVVLAVEEYERLTENKKKHSSQQMVTQNEY
jgi:prevent-host-death family protein